MITKNISCSFHSLVIYGRDRRLVARAAQRAKFTKKVHKPSLRINVIDFELDGFSASIWVPWSPSDPKKL